MQDARTPEGRDQEGLALQVSGLACWDSSAKGASGQAGRHGSTESSDRGTGRAASKRTEKMASQASLPSFPRSHHALSRGSLAGTHRDVM